jgi:mRNA interferase RelE/StbE
MIGLFDRSFGKSLDKLKDKNVKSRVKALIESMEKAGAITDLKGVKALKGNTGFCRVRIGDYRAGFEITGKNEILLILVAHRKDIYKRFPK